MRYLFVFKANNPWKKGGVRSLTFNLNLERGERAGGPSESREIMYGCVITILGTWVKFNIGQILCVSLLFDITL